MVKMPALKKKTISKKLREEVWLKHFGKTFSSKCPIIWCTRKITVFCFEVGHNIPESKGGTTTINNLIPICGDCNRSMGDRFTIDEFSRQFADTSAAPVPLTFLQRIFCFFQKKSVTSSIKKKPQIGRHRSAVRTIFK
jgi:hypothetical protein